MVRMSQTVRVVIAILVAGVLTACSATFQNHGYIPPQKQLDAILIGLDTRDTLRQSIGAPGTTGLRTDGAWYYVQSRYRNFTYNAPEEIERQVLAISFDARGRVANIERFGLEDGRIVALSRRVTESTVQGRGFLAQLFGNFGRLDVSQML